MVTIKEIRNKRIKRNNVVNEDDDIDEHHRNIKYDDDDHDHDDNDSSEEDNDDDSSEKDDDDEEQESLHEDNQLYSDDNCEFENDSDDTDDDDDDDDEDTDDDTKKRKHNENSNIVDEYEIRNLPLGERLRRQMEQGDINNTKWKQIRKEKHDSTVSKSTKLNKNNSTKKDNNTITKKKTKEEIIIKKKSKHLPKEMSSKRKDFYHQQKIDLLSGGCTSIGTSINVHANIYKPCDPRSNTNNIHTTSITTSTTSNKSRGGKKLLLETLHDRNDYQYEDYAFIQEMRNEEIQTIQKRIKAYQMTGRKGQEHRKRYNCNTNNNIENGLLEDQKLLHQLLQEKANYERKQLDITTKRIVQETIYKKRKHDNSKNNQDTTGIGGDQNDHQHSSKSNNNKKKYVPKARDVKRMYIETKYDLLQQQKGGQNKIDKIIYKKHLKNKSKDSKFM